MLQLKGTDASILGAFACAVILAVAINAQAPPPRPQPIESPAVHPDRTVTVSVRSPNAKQVRAQPARMPQAAQTPSAPQTPGPAKATPVSEDAFLGTATYRLYDGDAPGAVGKSGLGLGDPSLDQWSGLLEAWLRGRGLLAK